VEHFCVKFGDPSCISFKETMRKTDRHTEKRRKTLHPATVVGVSN